VSAEGAFIDQLAPSRLKPRHGMENVLRSGAPIVPKPQLPPPPQAPIS